MTECLLKLSDVSVYRDGTPVLTDVSLHIAPGEIIGIVGDNGLGKSTLLELMAGRLKIASGSMDTYQTRISFVPALRDFETWNRVCDTLFFYDTYYYHFDIEKALSLLAESQISPREKLTKLSRGQQERLFLILSISQDATLYLMDEPFSGIDPYFKKDIRQFLLKNIPEGATILMATHLLRELEQLFDEVIFVSETGVSQMMADDIRTNENKSIEEYYLEVISHGKTKN